MMSAAIAGAMLFRHGEVLFRHGGTELSRGGMKFTPWWNGLASAAFPFGHRGNICKRQGRQMEQSLVCFSMNISECFSRNC